MKSALFGSVDPVPGLKGKVITNGRLNVARALQYLTNADPALIVTGAYPAGPRAASNAPINLTFNRPVDRASVESALTITPPLRGRFSWSSDDRRLEFEHDVPFDVATRYQVRLAASARDTAGGTLDGNFNRLKEQSPTDDFSWTFSFAIPNDDFADAQILQGSSGFLLGTNLYATREVSEPDFMISGSAAAYAISDASVWYKWTPPVDNWITIDLTTGTSFDSLLSVYKGDTLENLIAVAENDNYGTRTASRVSFPGSADVRYFIAISRRTRNSGDAAQFKLAWYPTPPPAFTGSQFFPASGAPGARVTLTGTNFTGATAVLFNGASASFTNALTNNLDLRITTTVPPEATSGPITILSPHGNVTSTAMFQVDRPTLSVRSATATELTLSWTGLTFLLESSIDLRTWIQVATPGSSNAVINLNQNRAFFRLRSP